MGISSIYSFSIQLLTYQSNIPHTVFLRSLLALLLTSILNRPTIFIVMKKIAFLSIAISLLGFLTPQAFASQTINACPQGGQFNALCVLDAQHFGSVLGAAVTFVFVIATIIALGYLIWGGIKWIISQGDKQGVENARNHIIAAIIGLVLIFVSYLVINIVLSFFAPGTSLMNLQLPSLHL